MEDIRNVDGREMIIDWNLKHQMAFVFEVNSDIVRNIIPKKTGLQPYEARPGIGLMFCGYNNYNAGNTIFGKKQEPFIEITRVFMVQPNLSLNMPLPRFTFYVHRIASNNPDFIKQEIEALYLPSYYSPAMVSETSNNHTDLLVKDSDGIMRQLRNTNPTPVYRNDSFFGQYYSVQNNKLYFGVFYWAGKVCVHQKRGDAGGDLAHPFLTDMETTFDPKEIGGPYLQMITEYDTPLVQRFYEPQMIREL